MQLAELFDISLARANQFYAWGWRLSAFGAVITLCGVALLWWGTRVRDREAETQLATLNHSAADSRERAAKLEARAAELENEAEQARLALEKLKGQVSGRRLTEAQAHTITQNLSGLQLASLTLSAIASDAESMRFAQDIRGALKAAGFDVQIQSSVIFGTGPIVGLIISGPKVDIIRVGEAFVRAGINVTGKEREGAVNILVGSKSPPNP